MTTWQGLASRRTGLRRVVNAGVVLALLAMLLVAAVSASAEPTSSAASSSGAAVGTTYVVDTTDGATDALLCRGGSDCSFGDAIAEANANPGKDTIQFSVPGSAPYVIVLPALGIGTFPDVTEAVVIDGLSQGGAGYSGPPLVEIDAIGRGAFGLRVLGDRSVGTEIRGIAIYGRNTNGDDYAIEIDNPGSNIVERNYIGTNAAATIARGASGILVRPTTSGAGSTGNRIVDNVIAGLGGAGVALEEVDASELSRNRIGTNASGTAGLSGRLGVGISLSYSSGNLLDGNVIADRNRGIRIFGSTGLPSEGNRIEGNRIGTDIFGAVGLGNSTFGIDIGGLAPGTTIGGADRAARNVISGNAEGGVALTGTVDGTVVQGNLIGTDSTGANGLGNGLRSAAGVGIGVLQTGGSLLIVDNVISGNFGDGISGGPSATGSLHIEHNLVGTNEEGSAELPNTQTGVTITNNLAGSVIGGDSASQGNVISGNGGDGISTGVEAGLSVFNNYIGTDKDGIASLGNAGHGIFAAGGSAGVAVTRIGKPGAGNVISGNGKSGVFLLGDGATVQANRIGTDANGKNDLGNTADGVAGTPTWRNAQIGGGGAGEGNLIAGNDGWGINLSAQDASVVQGNRIGTDIDGAALPNALGGLKITNTLFFDDTADVSGNVISLNTGPGVSLGGTQSRIHENTLASNGGDGVAVAGSRAADNTISQNRIASNQGLGIDLDPDGVTPNDLGDGDGGANLRQNFPVSLQVSADRTTVTGTLNSRPNSNFRIELFGNSACDPSGNGEGETYLAATEKPTDGNGNASFSITLPTALPGSDVVTATATDLSPGTGNTSEFSQCAQVPPPGTIVVRKSTQPSPDPSDTIFALTAGGGLSPANFTLKNGESRTFANLVPRAGYSVAEVAPVGWDLTSATCSDDSPISNITVSAGETVTCTFVNTRRGRVIVPKTVGGVTPGVNQSFSFELRQGASMTNSGTILESKPANAANGGVVVFATLLVPATTYALCEMVMPGWVTTLGPPVYVVYNPSGDNSTVCTDFTVEFGETKTVPIDNREPPGGLARTIGFWKNWASCAGSGGKQKPVLDQTLAASDPSGTTIGLLTLHAGDCLKAVRLLDKSTIDTGKKMASDPAFGLAAQLLAARLNITAGAGSCPAAVTAINSAQTLLAGTHFNGVTHDKLTAAQATQANSLAGSLDRYNNNLLC